MYIRDKRSPTPASAASFDSLFWTIPIPTISCAYRRIAYGKVYSLTWVFARSRTAQTAREQRTLTQTEIAERCGLKGVNQWWQETGSSSMAEAITYVLLNLVRTGVDILLLRFSGTLAYWWGKPLHFRGSSMGRWGNLLFCPCPLLQIFRCKTARYDLRRNWMIKFQFFPRSQGITEPIQQVINCFRAVDAEIGSKSKTSLVMQFLTSCALGCRRSVSKLRREKRRTKKSAYPFFSVSTIKSISHLTRTPLARTEKS